MDKKMKPAKKNDHAAPKKTHEITPPIDPEEPLHQEEDPDEIPEEDPFSVRPDEVPVQVKDPKKIKIKQWDDECHVFSYVKYSPLSIITNQ